MVDPTTVTDKLAFVGGYSRVNNIIIITIVLIIIVIIIL